MLNQSIKQEIGFLEIIIFNKFDELISRLPCTGANEFQINFVSRWIDGPLTINYGY